MRYFIGCYYKKCAISSLVRFVSGFGLWGWLMQLLRWRCYFFLFVLVHLNFPMPKQR